MITINIDTEKVLDMIVQNAASKQESLGMDNGVLIANSFGVEYMYPSQGTYFQNCHVVDPTELFYYDAINQNYDLDVVSFKADARDAVFEENNKSENEEYTEKEEDTIYEYVSGYIKEWKEWARYEKKNVLKIEDAEGKVVAEYDIVWE